MNETVADQVADKAINIHSLNFSFRQGKHHQTILDDVTLNVGAGEVTVLTGPSGSGKSTLLTIVGGLRTAEDGSVEVLGQQLVKARQRVLVKLRRKIGFIFQQHNLSSALSIAQNIQMGLQHSGAHRPREATDKIEAIAATLGLSDQLRKYPDQLSGGQQQRAGIARALVNQPRLVLADEPTASLDKNSGEAVMGLFNELAGRGSAVVLVTHDKRILDQADRVLSLEDGRVVPTADVLIADTSKALRKLMTLDPSRLGRLLAFGQALAQVAASDGNIDLSERNAMFEALSAKGVLLDNEVNLVMELALAQVHTPNTIEISADDRAQFADSLKAVALADGHMSEAERQLIDSLISHP